MSSKKIVIIGAGIGGLSAGAFLSRNGMDVTILEKTDFPGGRCYVRNVDGYQFNIGALYIGEKAPQIIKKYFGFELNYKPFRMGVVLNSSFVSLPFDRIALKELKSTGISYKELGQFFFNIPMLFRQNTFKKVASVGELIFRLSSNMIIRRLGFVLFGVLGVNPNMIPSHYLKMGNNTQGPVVGNPVYIEGGNQKIADTLVKIIESNGGSIRFNTKVTEVSTDKKKVKYVYADERIEADVFISNSGIKATFLDLIDKEKQSLKSYQSINELRQGLRVINVFIKFSEGTEFSDNFGIYFYAYDPIKDFASLDNGEYSTSPMFILYIPTNLEISNKNHHGTLQYYIPDGPINIDKIKSQADWIIREGLNKISPGLATNVASYQVYDPDLYEKEFGFKPIVYEVAPIIGQKRFPWHTEFENLYCVGDSVQPHRPSVPQALESGILCAQEIIKRMD